MGREAQNALLKTFEEPIKGNYFFLITPSAERLLSTLRSRLFILPSKKVKEEGSDVEKLAEDFFKNSISKRLEIAKNIAEDIKDEKRTKSYALDFVQGLEGIYQGKNISKQKVKGLEEIIKCEEYLTTPSASVKMILEGIRYIDEISGS